MRTDVSEYELRLRQRWEISRGGTDVKRNAFVRVERDGTTGEGEAACHGHFGESPASVRAGLERAAKELTAGVPEDLDELGLTGAARAAMEMAILDWGAKRDGMSLGAMLGVAPSGDPFVTSFSIGIDRPEAMAEKTRAARAFEVLKVKLGTATDRERFEAVRSVSEVPVRVDANGGWESRDEAARMIEWLADGRGVELIEQPLPPGRLEDTAWLRERSPIPIVLDEDVRSAADIPALAGVCAGINIKLMKAGGLREAKRMAGTAREHGMKVMLGCMIESSLAIGAALHLAPLADWVDLDGHLLVANDPYEGIARAGGRLAVPTGPGIGVRRVSRP